MLIKKIDHTASSSFSSYHDIMPKLIEDCRNEPNKDKRIEILNQINSMLLKSDQLSIPSQITSEHAKQILHRIEGTLLLLDESK